MIRIFNSMTGQKEDLQPLQPGRISMYVCGDTVFDLSHMGHARSKIAFDVVRRYLTFSGFAVNFVRNITDVDDKIINQAKLEKVATGPGIREADLKGALANPDKDKAKQQETTSEDDDGKVLIHESYPSAMRWPLA